MICPECGVAFAPSHHRQLFCTPAHKAAYNNRQVSRGFTPFFLAQVWQAARARRDPESREVAREAFALLCRAARDANADDREAGRADPVRVFLQRRAAGVA
ncbi:hypothetical protein [Phenylobacterium sp.]|uniref:hypothetical protein n=1 Tax=Phenylobacterium sp. TaxID=1871053 RepID=UPI00395256FA